MSSRGTVSRNDGLARLARQNTRGMGMTDVQIEEERRLAHSGGLARLAGACARRPWRVIGGWLGIVVVLIALNAAFHGKLINDFKIPGSDTQRATDLITSKFGGQKGAALRVVLASKDGQPLTSPAHTSAVRRMLAA